MSGERVSPGKINTFAEYLIYLKGVFVYEWCKDLVGEDLCLDLGCGDGYGTKLLSSGGIKAVGVDVDKKTVAKARQCYGGENCTFEFYNGVDLPFADNSFDAVVSFHVIEHVKDDSHFISEVYRVLKNQGVFIVSTPNKALRLPKGGAPWNVFHIREYSASEIKDLLNKKFEDVRLMGLTAIDEVKSIEKARIKQNLKIISFDVFNLRRILPPFIVSGFIGALRSVLGIFKKTRSREDINRKDEDCFKFYRVEEGDIEALDILAVCRK